MKVILFGATGMVGQGVLRECLRAQDVTGILAVGRTSLEAPHPKLKELLQPDLFTLARVRDQLSGYDACFFCLGVSSAGMTEGQYGHLTYDLTLGIAELLAELNPDMVFTYVSGAGTDSSERGRSMWARVKGKTENELLRLPFKAAYMFRPGLIQPLYGIRSKTRAYRLFYILTAPLLPMFRRMFPDQILTTEQVGRAMLTVARSGAPKRILESADIRAIAL